MLQKLPLLFSSVRSRMVVQIACLFVLSSAASVLAQNSNTFAFMFAEKAGPFAVGLKVVEQYDVSRDFLPAESSALPASQTDSKRPLQTLIWYPALATEKPKMTLGDYQAQVYTETSFGKPVTTGKPQGFIESFMKGTTERRSWAERDAPLATARFPIVIYAPSVNATSTENIELCEYLASEGFVVLASPSMGAKSRTMTVDLAGADAEVKDIEFLINFAMTLPDTNRSKVAVIGYSWGGMSALFAAARDSRINALVSLDGSFRYSPDLVQQAADVHPDQMTIPMLVFSRGEETLETWDAMRKDKSACVSAPNVLNEWKGELAHVRLLGISHIQFSSLYQRSERFKNEGVQFVPADYTLADGNESYNWMARYTAEFLKASLNGEGPANLFLGHRPEENGVPRHLIDAKVRLPAPR